MLKFLILIFFITSSNIIASENKMSIIVSFSILEDLTSNIVSDKANISTIVPRGSDSHNYTLTPKNLIALEKSDLFIINGLGYEGFLDRLKINKNILKKTLITTENIPVLKNSTKHTHNIQLSNNSIDPHVWQNPINTITIIKNITNTLCIKDKKNCDFYKLNASKYITKINEIDNKYELLFKNIKNENKILITSHSAFNYLGQRYNIKIYSAYGIDSHSEPSAKNLAFLSNLIKKYKIKTIFIENMTNNSIITELAKQHNVSLNGMLYSDSLCNPKNCKVTTYLDLIENNLQTIYQAMIK
jgi:zinc/manganese transport system substrate-binding protein